MWRTLESGPQDGVTNMALDLALLDLAHDEGTAVLRTYGWTRPTVSFGRNEPVRLAWDVAAMQVAGYDIIRRPTGGRALLHSHEVTYSVVLPLPRDVPWRWAYAAVNERLVEALRALGVPVTLIAAAEAPAVAPDGPACFAAPAAGELSVGGRKLVGSAVWRTAGAYLQHGAILLRDTQDQLAPFRLTPPGLEPPAHATGLEQCLAPTTDALPVRITAAVHEAWRATATISAWPAAETRHGTFVDRIGAHARRLDDPSWLWRR